MTEQQRAPESDAGVTVSPLSVIGAVVRQRFVLLAWPVGVGLAALAATLVFSGFEAEAKFSLNTAPTSPLTSVAAQFGVNLGSTGSSSPQIYPHIVRSRALLRRVVGDTVVLSDAEGGPPRRERVGRALGFAEDTVSEEIDEAVDELLDNVTVTPDDASGTVSIRVSLPSRELAEGVARVIFEEVIRFDSVQRRTNARTEREFLEQRVAVASAELGVVEGELERFLVVNARIEGPRLELERQRLMRRVEIAQQVYMTLSQGLEQARIEEVRHAPVTTLIETPEGSAKRALKPMLVGIFGVIVGALLGLLWALGREWLRWSREVSPEETAELVAQLRAVFRRSQRA